MVSDSSRRARSSIINWTAKRILVHYGQHLQTETPQSHSLATTRFRIEYQNNNLAVQIYAVWREPTVGTQARASPRGLLGARASRCAARALVIPLPSRYWDPDPKPARAASRVSLGDAPLPSRSTSSCEASHHWNGTSRASYAVLGCRDSLLWLGAWSPGSPCRPARLPQVGEEDNCAMRCEEMRLRFEPRWGGGQALSARRSARPADAHGEVKVNFWEAPTEVRGLAIWEHLVWPHEP